MAGRGNSFSRNHSTGNSSEGSLVPKPIPEEQGRDHLYSVDNEVVNDLRRHTTTYVKKIGGLPIIPEFPENNIRGNIVLYWKTQCWLEILKNS